MAYHAPQIKADVEVSEATIENFASLVSSPLPVEIVENGNMPEFNEQKETLDQKALSGQEIWSAIRYLDFEIEDKVTTRNAVVALAAALLIICITVCDPRNGDISITRE